MFIIEGTLGNLADDQWKAVAAHAKVDELRLSQWDAQKNRFRKTSEGGLELAVSLNRNTFLRDGDVLKWDQAAKTLVVAKILLRDVLVIDLTQLTGGDPDQLIRTCVELGHALGNQHWPAVVKDHRVFVPLTVDKKVMTSVMKTHAFKGVTYDFMPGSFVIPYLLPHEARRLFGGAEQESHAHPLATSAHDHKHENGAAAHSHHHDHGHDHEHRH